MHCPTPLPIEANKMNTNYVLSSSSFEQRPVPAAILCFKKHPSITSYPTMCIIVEQNILEIWQSAITKLLFQVWPSSSEWKIQPDRPTAQANWWRLKWTFSICSPWIALFPGRLDWRFFLLAGSFGWLAAVDRFISSSTSMALVLDSPWRSKRSDFIPRSSSKFWNWSATRFSGFLTIIWGVYGFWEPRVTWGLIVVLT